MTMPNPMNIFQVSGRAMSAQLVRMNTTASNLANAGGVASSEAGAYRTIKPVFEIESREGVWKAVEQGLGISVVADFEFVSHPNLRAIEIKDRVITTQYSIAYRKERAHSPIIKAFLATVGAMNIHVRHHRRS